MQPHRVLLHEELLLGALDGVDLLLQLLQLGLLPLLACVVGLLALLQLLPKTVHRGGVEKYNGFLEFRESFA